MKKRRRVLWVVLVAILAILSAEGLTYVFIGRDRVPTLMLGVLFGPPPKGGPRTTGYLCVAEKTWAALSSAQRQALDHALGHYYKTIYHGEAEIPKEEWFADRGGLRNGYVMSYDVQVNYGVWLAISFKLWRHGRSAEGGTASFVWVPGAWVEVRRGPRWVS